jgi:hypothetical protein
MCYRDGIAGIFFISGTIRRLGIWMLALYLLAAGKAAQSGSLADSHEYLAPFLKVYGLILVAALPLVGLLFIATKMLLAFLRTAEKQACPGCGSNHVRLSQRHGGIMDALAGMLGCAPLRCRACRLRYYARRARGSATDPDLAAQ